MFPQIDLDQSLRSRLLLVYHQLGNRQLLLKHPIDTHCPNTFQPMVQLVSHTMYIDQLHTYYLNRCGLLCFRRLLKVLE